jgi:outer membrane protein assembly factor BamB
MLCLDAASGRVIWKLRVEDHFGNPTPSVESDRVYGLSSTGMGVPTAYCWRASDGQQLWKRDLPASTGDRQYGHAGSTLLWQDLVILNAGAGAALKKTTGEVLWSHPGFPGLATPVLYQAKGVPCVALFGGDRLIAREARSGRQLWQIPWKTELAVNACDPILFDNKVFISSDYGRGRALYDVSGAQPQKLWEYPQGGGSSYSSGFFHQGQLYSFAEGSFVRLDIATGRPAWRTDGGDSAILIGDTLIVVHPRGEMRFGRLSATGVQNLGVADTGLRDLKSVPAYSNGRLYVRSETGKLACFQIGTPA